ncbi:tyrosine-type recombinase/integrase [Thiomonas sp. X19]|uniref:tyrosine-type recombinase/integrase n=1 Tax=Thiomonas sp. X19 TaxID=1050370 RepID=UPI0011BD4B7E|nr:tyrosine-type recombinase/integrase [Thiomonas sp. X19]
MALYKRKKIWWIDFTTPSGERVRTSACSGDRAQAQELHDKLKAEAWRVAKLGEKPVRTWDEAALKWLEESSHKATYAEDKAKLRWLQPHLSMRRLDSLTREVIAEIAGKKAGVSSNSTANRYLALIRAILRKAWLEWEWLDRAPKVSLYPEPKRRVRWLTLEQALRLLAELPEHQRNMVVFALATGLRQANVRDLRWDQIDMARKTAWIHPDEAKAGMGIGVPLNGDAMGILERCKGEHPERVFTFRGEPIAYANTRAWREAVIAPAL